MLIAKIGALDVALVTAAAALAASIAAPASAWLISRGELKFKRWNRVYDDRKAAYVALLKGQHAILADTSMLVRAVLRNDATLIEHIPGIERPGDSVSRRAAFFVFATKEVTEAWRDYMFVYNEQMATLPFDGIPPTEAERQTTALDFEARRLATQAALRPVQEAMQRDLAKLR